MKKVILLVLFFSVSAFGASAPTLKIHWLGTASYLIQFGDVSILTDPFYSQSGLIQTGIGTVKSNPKIVREVRQAIKNDIKPSAIFIGHAHYDHMLDTAELLTQTQWHTIPVYGNRSCGNILAGYGPNIAQHFRPTQADGQWHQVAKGVRYMAMPSEHPNQLPGVFFYPGKLSNPLSSPPTKAKDFPVGQTYTYLFELSSGPFKKTIFFTGASSSYPIGSPGSAIKTVDVEILCVPSWQATTGYPDRLIKRFQPKVVIASHFNDFLTHIDSFFEPRSTLYTAHLSPFLQQAKKASGYPRFKKLIAPKVNDTIEVS